MNEKIRTTIYVNKHNWEELDKYIDCTKSEWIDNQIKKRITQHDDVAKIERQMKEILMEQENLKMEFKTLTEQKEQLLKQRKDNETNYKIMGEAMDTIRTIANNQGYIEKTRVEYIANKHNISVELLIKQIEKENIPIKDIKQERNVDLNMRSPY